MVRVCVVRVCVVRVCVVRCGEGVCRQSASCWSCCQKIPLPKVAVKSASSSLRHSWDGQWPRTASLALWLRRLPPERKIPGSNPACAGIISGRVIPVT